MTQPEFRQAPRGERFVRVLPGQYYDAETGKHYNYYRDYDPTLGRYVESDPIGLRAGANTYGYVLAQPLLFSDRRGLANGAAAASMWKPKPCVGNCDNKVVNVSIGAGGAGGGGVFGGSADSGFGFDSEGNSCIYSMICGMSVGMGLMAGGSLGGVGAVGGGRLCSGQHVCVGGFRTGGHGVTGEIQALACTDGSVGTSRMFGGIGENWGGGGLVCVLTLVCGKDSQCCGTH
jgi:RHS repeat-associated protein